MTLPLGNFCQLFNKLIHLQPTGHEASKSDVLACKLLNVCHIV